MQEKAWFARWPVGLPRSLEYPEVPVYAFLESTARKYPEKAGLVFLGGEHTYGKLREEALSFASSLKAMGVGRGDVVALHLPNSWQFFVAYYGLLYAGAVFSPVSPLLAPGEVERQLQDSAARVFVGLDLLWGNVREAVERSPVKEVVLTSVSEALPGGEPLDVGGLGDVRSFRKLLESPPLERPEEVEPGQDLAHLAYTGGTTGVPKGVMLTHLNVVTNVLQYAHWQSSGRPIWTGEYFETVEEYQPPTEGWEYPGQGMEGEGRAVIVVPWFHAMGTVGYLNIPVYGATRMVVHPRFDPAAYIQDAAREGATTIGGAPPLFIALLQNPSFLEQNWSSVRLIASGAAPLPVELLERLRAAFPQAVVLEAYGLTEVTMGATANPANRSGTRKVGSVGIPVFDTEVKVVDLETGEKEVPTGEPGEIAIRGPQVMQGYLGRPRETAEVLREGWVYTGDIGRMDEEGYLYIVDRKKDMLIYKGYNVYPRELEEILFTHPAVASAAVVGLPDPEAGEIPAAVVVRKAGVEVSEEALMDYVNSRVAAYKKLRRLVFVESIPVSEAGKVLKRVLKEQLRQG